MRLWILLGLSSCSLLMLLILFWFVRAGWLDAVQWMNELRQVQRDRHEALRKLVGEVQDVLLESVDLGVKRGTETVLGMRGELDALRAEIRAERADRVAERRRIEALPVGSFLLSDQDVAKMEQEALRSDDHRLGGPPRPESSSSPLQGSGPPSRPEHWRRPAPLSGRTSSS